MVLFIVSNSVVLPELNHFGRQGILLPSLQGLRFHNETIRLQQDAILISCDLKYEGPWNKQWGWSRGWEQPAYKDGNNKDDHGDGNYNGNKDDHQDGFKDEFENKPRDIHAQKKENN